MIKAVILCGGPSRERDISLNSARSVYDHMSTLGGVGAEVVFIDRDYSKYLIDEAFLYSNTSADFRFALRDNARRIEEKDFASFLKERDIVFPAIHGAYGEDGRLQSFLESENIPFTGPGSAACGRMYSKRAAEEYLLRPNGMYSIPKLFLAEPDSEAVERFFAENALEAVVVKPSEGGSSFGVAKACGLAETIRLIEEKLPEYGPLVVEKHCTGREFTVIILERDGVATALMPTEIELLQAGAIFDTRRKYLPTTETHYYCPARFGTELNARIRSEAGRLFELTGAHDFLRIDGWLLDDGNIYFSDFNPISGMEQNSFIFQQAAAVGLSHRALIGHILANACRRNGLDFTPEPVDNSSKRRVNILLGGNTSERQVSLMSGSNTWLKLRASRRFHPVPYLLYDDGGGLCTVEVPYAAVLNHTTEEIRWQLEHKLSCPEAEDILRRLGAEPDCSVSSTGPRTLEEFLDDTVRSDADIFICLHGGFGENGSLQRLLDERGIRYNGSPPESSALCMDKYLTGERINALGIDGLRSCRKLRFDAEELPGPDWRRITGYLGGGRVVVKPNSDGCSTGVVILDSAEALERYIELYRGGGAVIPENTFYNQTEKVQLSKNPGSLLFEEYIKTDKLFINADGTAGREPADGWVEMTVGVLEKNGRFHAMNPSVTIAESAVLSLEEKFQGGTGVNLTPPPEHISRTEMNACIRAKMESVAKAFGIRDYCRIDLFANDTSGEVIVIEINTLPGLSPSTVLFQQASKETPPLSPTGLLEYIIMKEEAAI